VHSGPAQFLLYYFISFHFDSGNMAHRQQ